MDGAVPGLPELLRPYKTAAIVEEIGVARQAVSQWRSGRTVPDVRYLPALAQFLKIDLGELTEIVATELRRRDAAARVVA
jgi:transcriptional regulator with XRE-family HTH domain